MFLNPLGLLALLAVPTVVALHLFRRRFRPQVVSALFLWQLEDRTSLAGRKREKLRTSASFWCEVLGALCLALAFAGPRVFGAGQAGHLVVVLDGSASMGARTDEGGLADRAADLVRERIDELPRRSRVTVVASGPRPTLLAGPAAYPGEARDALDGWSPTSPRHDLTPAVAFGLQLAGEGSALLVTDRFQPDAFPPEVEIAALGEPLDNVALTRAARSRVRADSGEVVEKVFLSISSYSRRPALARLALDAEGVEIASRELELAPGERKHLAFELPEGTPTIEARLAGDALPIDDRAVLAPVPPRTVALASTLPSELGRWLGLTSGGGSAIDRWCEIVPDSLDAVDAAAAHLTVTSAPVDSPRTWSLVLAASGEDRQDLIGPFLAERHHPALEGVTLEGIVWSAETGRALPGAPLVSAGNVPLLTEEQDGGRRVFHLNLDPLRSSLQRSPDWPILLANLAELRRRELPGPERANLGVGERLVFRGEGEGTYLLEGPGDRRELPSRGTLVVDGLGSPGRYTLSKDGRELCELGVSFTDPGESDLRELGEGERVSSLQLARVRAGLGWVEMLLLFCGLCLFVADWLVLGRTTSEEG